MALFGNKKNDSAEEKTSMADLYEGKTVKKTATKEAKVEKKAIRTESAKILIKPLVTEKASHLASENKYAFIVALNANKIEVAKAVKALYGVDVVKVNIINMEGKNVVRGRIKGQRSDFKKAIVTLKKGDVISIYEGV